MISSLLKSIPTNGSSKNKFYFQTLEHVLQGHVVVVLRLAVRFVYGAAVLVLNRP